MINIKRIFSLLALTFLILPISAQDRISVLTLGTFHFNFPNLDRVQVAGEDQVDVLEMKYQNEIENLVEQLEEYKPSIIVIERRPELQNKIDSLYKQYLAGEYELKRGEEEQIGFRLAKCLGIDRLYCVDEWGEPYERIDKLTDDTDSENYINFEKSFSEHPDSTKRFEPKNIFKEEGIIKQLIELNKRNNIQKSLGNYLIGHFKYESIPYDYTGVDFETGRWFNRNLRIFRNIQRIETSPSDRILIIFGAGHLNILNYLFECSPEYHLEDTNNYLDFANAKSID